MFCLPFLFVFSFFPCVPHKLLMGVIYACFIFCLLFVLLFSELRLGARLACLYVFCFVQQPFLTPAAAEVGYAMSWIQAVAIHPFWQHPRLTASASHYLICGILLVSSALMGQLVGKGRVPLFSKSPLLSPPSADFYSGQTHVKLATHKINFITRPWHI